MNWKNIKRKTLEGILIAGGLLAGFSLGGCTNKELVQLKREYPDMKIVFVSEEPYIGGKFPFTYKGYSRKLCISEIDGDKRKVFSGSKAEEYCPAVSSDGKVAFVSNRDGNENIYIMNIDGSNEKKLTSGPSPSTDFGGNRWPSFSPDGKKIAFASGRIGNCRIGNHEIFIMNSDGSSQTRLTNNPKDDFFPTFSPDGKKIAFYSNRDGNYAIYIMNTDGSSQTRLFRGYFPKLQNLATKIKDKHERL